MSSTTSMVGTKARPFTLSELTDALERAGKRPAGFIVSEAIWNGLQHRLPQSMARGDLRGVPIVVDASLPETTFEIAHTQEAWRKRLTEIPIK